MSELEDQIKEEIAAHKIVIYGKGTKEAPNVVLLSKQFNFSINMGTHLKSSMRSQIQPNVRLLLK